MLSKSPSTALRAVRSAMGVRLKRVLLATAIPAIFAATGASAENVLIDEIVVTAQKRAENIQNVPLAVSAYSGDQLKAMNIQDATRIVDLIPNFKAGGLGGPSGPPFFSIRGISFVDFSNINEASVAVYVDEVYQASQGIGVAQTYDLDHVEVLRGPQGTLFGRNATAGVVSFASKKPTDEVKGDISFQYGDANQTIVQGAIGGPLGEGFRARLAGKWNRDDGWQKNQGVSGGRAGKTNAKAARLTAQMDLADDWMLEVQGHYAENKGLSTAQMPLWIYGPPDPVTGRPTTYCAGRDATGALIRPVPGTANDQLHANCLLGNKGYSFAGFTRSEFDPAKPTFDYAMPFNYTSKGGYGKLTGQVGEATLTSITAYEEYSQLFGYDFDNWDNRPYRTGPYFDVHTYWDSSAKQVSQELRLNGERNGVKYVGGLYFYRSTQQAYSGSEFDLRRDQIGLSVVDDPTLDPRNTKTLAKTTTQSYAIFGQVDAPVSDTLTVSAGLRYTNDSRKGKFTFFPACGLGPGEAAVNANVNTASLLYCNADAAPSIATEAATGRAAIEWRPADDQLYFFQYSHGFKSGGYNATRPVFQRGPVNEETVDSFELGMKRYFLDRKLRVNSSVYYYKFHGLQALIGTFDPLTNTTTVLYINAGDPRTYGAEVETTWALTDNFEVAFNVGLLDTKVIANPRFTADGRTFNGNKLVQAPKVSLNGIVRYTIPMGDAGTLTLQGDGRWQEKSFTGIDNDPTETLSAFGVVNARVQWRNAAKNIALEAFVDNVFDKTIIQHIFHPTIGNYPTTINPAVLDSGFRTVGRDRSWGVKASYDF